MLALLEHKDYQVELERYSKLGVGFTKEEYVDFFVNIRKRSSAEIQNRTLKNRAEDLLHIIDNVPHYRSVYNSIKDLSEKDIAHFAKKTEFGLPDHIGFDGANLIFGIGLGGSTGWAYKDISHYDLKNVVDSNECGDLASIIAHELHHFGFNQIMANVKAEDLQQNPAEALLVYLSGEGTAIKYCNNFEGQFTKKLYPEEPMMVHQASYEYYMNHFPQIMAALKDDVKRLGKGNVTVADIGKTFQENYFYSDVLMDGQKREQYLMQPVAYFLGADLWGLLHDSFGKERVFNLLTDFKELIELLNEALCAKGFDQYCL